MPEEITQKLGFDASSAIEQLRKLQEQLNQFKLGLESTNKALTKFTTKAKPASAALRELGSAAKTARSAMQGLAKAGGVPPSVPATVQKTNQAFSSLGQTVVSAGAGFSQYSTGVNRGVTAVTSLGQAAAQSSRVVQQGATTTAGAAAKVENSMNNAGNAGQNAAKLITLSWKTVIRVVQAQVIVRALSKLVSGFFEAHEAAKQLSIAVGEVSTIARGALGSFDEASASVLELSTNLGIAADEVAEGLYQTLSNQVVEAGDALRFEENAAKLSIATHSELKESVNALSSIMNSYALDVSEVDRVSDVLFKTIELGRLRMGEFGDVLGRVTPLTAALGIKYEEMAAAIAALTQKGVPAHTAITQLTQVSQKLLRPTEKLQELYHQWGVEDGPEAIRRFGGLQGVLLKMKDATAGSSKEFADLLGRVRAMVGALNLTSNEGNALNAALEEMENSAGAAKKAFELMEETTGRKAEKAWNALSNQVIKFGKSLLEVSAPIAKVITLLTSNFDYLAAAMLGVGAAALVMSGKFALAALTLAGFSVSVKALAASLLSLWPIALAVAAAMATIYVTKAIQDWSDVQTEIMERQKKNTEEWTAAHEAWSQRRIQTTKKEFEEISKITSAGWAAQTKAYKRAVLAFEAESTGIKTVITNTINDLFQQRKKMIDEIRKAATGADDAIKTSMEVIAKTQESISDSAFKREKRNMSDRQKLWAEIERAQDAAGRARKAYATAGANEEDAAHARKLSQLAESRAEEAVSTAEELGHKGDIRRAENELDKIRQTRIRSELGFQAERRKLQDATHKEELLRLDQAGVKAEKLYKKLIKLADPMAKAGVPKLMAQIKADTLEIAELMPEIQASLEAAFPSDFDIFERLNIQESMDKIKSELQSSFSKAQIDWSNITTELQTTLSQKVYTVGVKIEIENEHIIKEFVKRFGEIDIFKDAGKMGSQMEIVLKDIIANWEALQRKIENTTKTSIDALKNSIESISFDNIHTGFGKVDKGVEGIRSGLEILAQQALGLAEAGKPWTGEMRLQHAQLLGIAEIMRKNGELTNNQVKGFKNAFNQLAKGQKASLEAVEATNEQLEMGEGSYLNAVEALDKKVAAEKAATEAAKATTQEAVGTKEQLEGAKQAVVDMPGVAAQATEAISKETNQASLLKAELQGAVQAQKDLTLAKTVPAEAAAAPTQPPPPEKTAEELNAQAEAARQLTSELIKVDTQFSTVLENIDGVTQAIGGTAEIAAQIAASMDQAAMAVGTLQFGFEAVTVHITTGIELMGNLTTAINGAATATNAATTAAGSWQTQLQGCANAGYAAEAAMRAAAAAAMAAAAACASASAACSGGSAAAYYGGPSVRYRSDGGFSPRGQDRIPIMAAPGEFIVSAKNARRFSSQLQAMNTGREPIYRERGGPVTNIGDVNVSVTQGEGASQTARDIATALQRELRRGTSRLS